MSHYVIRRLLLMIPTLIGVSLLVTAFVRLLPGDAIDILVSNSEVQGGSNAFKALVDEELEANGVDPATASPEQRQEVEDQLIDEQLESEGIDPATVTTDPTAVAVDPATTATTAPVDPAATTVPATPTTSTTP